jgi:hypothetical protein
MQTYVSGRRPFVRKTTVLLAACIAAVFASWALARIVGQKLSEKWGQPVVT